jgi:hypothetical protein
LALACVDKPGRLSDAVIIMAVEIRHTMLESYGVTVEGPGFLDGTHTGGHNITIVSRSYMVLAGRIACVLSQEPTLPQCCSCTAV